MKIAAPEASGAVKAESVVMCLVLKDAVLPPSLAAIGRRVTGNDDMGMSSGCALRQKLRQGPCLCALRMPM